MLCLHTKPITIILSILSCHPAFDVCNVLLMQVDFRIMCKNAMIYNKPETIYHKAARKLLHSGMKILSQV